MLRVIQCWCFFAGLRKETPGRRTLIMFSFLERETGDLPLCRIEEFRLPDNERRVILKCSQITLCAVFVVAFAQAQTVSPDLSWTLPWGTSQAGLLFEDTNLTTSVKAAIRDDVARILSFNSLENASFETLSPGSSYYGKWTGNMTLTNAVLPRLLPLSYYKTCSDTNYFVIEEKVCLAYLDKILLTNQNALAINSLSNFVSMINQVTTNNLSSAGFRSLFWSINEDRSISQTDFSEYNPDYIKAISEMATFTHLYISILDFELGTINGSSWLSVNVHVRKKNNPGDVWTDIPLIFRGGQWRFIPGYEMP
jgi:hypothetical protein